MLVGVGYFRQPRIASVKIAIGKTQKAKRIEREESMKDAKRG
jgi:hypothetical protein